VNLGTWFWAQIASSAEANIPSFHNRENVVHF